MTRHRPRQTIRPRCPLHDVELLVGSTQGDVQYRYCRVPDCDVSIRTLRRPDARPRERPPSSPRDARDDRRDPRRAVGDCARPASAATLRDS